jgi:hypothetical protein
VKPLAPLRVFLRLGKVVRVPTRIEHVPPVVAPVRLQQTNIIQVQFDLRTSLHMMVAWPARLVGTVAVYSGTRYLIAQHTIWTHWRRI